MEIKIFDKVPEDALYVRDEVFTKEQGFIDDFDELDNSSIHVVIYIDNKPVATGRTFLKNNSYVIGRVAVLKEHRGKNLGTFIIKSLEEQIINKHDKVVLSSQVHAIEFYEKQGYVQTGEIYLDQDSPHKKLVKYLKK